MGSKHGESGVVALTTGSVPLTETGVDRDCLSFTTHSASI